MSGNSGSDPLSDILDRSYRYLRSCTLRPFLLTLPLHGPASKSNQAGIREKIMKNKSYIVTDQNPKSDFSRDSPNSIECINQMIDRLTSDSIVGFVLVVAKYLGPEDEPTDTDADAAATSAYQYRPVAGGIVEMLDEHERAVRGVWCRRSVLPNVSQELLTVTVMRLLAHAFEWQHPSTNKRVSSKLVSSLEVHSLTFPTETYDFMTTPLGLNLSKHWETQEDGGAHNDSPNQKCKCFKLSDKEDAWQFWGISESRFLKAWSLRKDSLIPLVPAKDVLEAFSNAHSSSETPHTNKRDQQNLHLQESNSKRSGTLKS